MQKGLKIVTVLMQAKIKKMVTWGSQIENQYEPIRMAILPQVARVSLPPPVEVTFFSLRMPDMLKVKKQLTPWTSCRAWLLSRNGYATSQLRKPL